jgi:hypothetical protein
MKLYFNRKLIEMEWKPLMESDMWYSMEPAIFKIKSIHRTDYHSLLKTKKVHPDHHRFNIDVYKFKDSDNTELGLFDLEIIMHSNRVIKRRKGGYLDIILSVSISEQSEKDKSELRDMLLETLIYS